MSKTKPARLLLPLALLFALAHTAAAQQGAVAARVVPNWRSPSVAQQETRRALSSLPDSQAVLFVNASRIIHDVLPRLMTAADYAKMLNEAQKVGLEPQGLNYVAIGARLADPPPANNLPEFVVVINGSFNADTLLAVGRVAAGAQNVSPRRETYGSKTLEIIDLESLGKKPEAAAGGTGEGEGGPPQPMPYKEVAVMALDANTLVVGVPAYVRALVDAAGGRGALRPSMVDLATRDPQALWSLTAELPPTLTDYLHKFGVPANEQMDEMVGWVKQVSLAQGMDALNYTLSASLLTDAPEHASAFSGLVRMGQLAAQTALSSEAAKQGPKHKDYGRTRMALDAVKAFVNRTDGNTLLLSVAVPQKTLNDLIKKEMVPARKSAATSAGKQPAGKATGKRPRPRRR